MIATRETRIVDASNDAKAAAYAFAQKDTAAGLHAVQKAHDTLVAVWDEGPRVDDVTILWDIRNNINRLQRVLDMTPTITFPAAAMDICDRAYGSLTRIADRWV